MDHAAELEEEKQVRLREILFLQNICNSLSKSDQDQLRKAMVVMLYAQFEGYAKFTFEVYRRAVERSQLKCSEVQPVLATAALKDLFKAIKNPDSAPTYLPHALHKVAELRSLGIERAFVEKAWEFGQRNVVLPEKFIDMESNLNPTVLRKNLFRLGLPHDLFDSLEASINKLLRFRNDIAHGKFVGGIDELDYQELYNAVTAVMEELKKTVVNCIDSNAFKLPTISS